MDNPRNDTERTEFFDPAAWHRSLIKPTRYKSGGSSVRDRTIDEEAASDRARVTYSSAFRRLQHKTQVFTLSKDAAVRTRLTHSLEVASVGRWVAQKVVDRALEPAGLEPVYRSAFVSLVETGCLAHDIGNPPFGHFGEAAIRKWFRDEWKRVAGARAGNENLQRLIEDFLQFDGNPQGTRILTRLQGRLRDERRKYGMDLTYSQVLTALKYPRGPLDTGKWKKAGFFESERCKIESAWKEFGFDFQAQRRFPLAYLVEAADDISYCISDMEDGIDQAVLTPVQFFNGLREWTNKNNPSPTLAELRKSSQSCSAQAVASSVEPAEAKDHFMVFKTDFTRAMIDEATRLYADGSSEDIRHGTRPGLLADTDAEDLLETLKGIARRFLYPADRVQTPFLAGLKVTHGILDEYSALLKLTQQEFALLREAWKSDDRKAVHEKGLETLLPLLDRLPSHYLDVYDSTAKDAQFLEKWGSEAWEWFCRAHLIVDYLSGMTDDFAYNTYQIVSGAQLE